MSNYFKNSEWIIDDMPVERNVLYYTCCDNPYPDVTFHLHLKVVTPVKFDEINSNVNLVINPCRLTIFHSSRANTF